MPYILKELRPREGDKWPEYTDPGGLNYRLTMLVRHARSKWKPVKTSKIVTWLLLEVNEYLDRIAVRDGKLGYTQFNEVLGVLAAAEREHEWREWWHRDEPERIEGIYAGFAIPRPSVFTQAGDLLYAARVRPYEERKIMENGDISESA